MNSQTTARRNTKSTKRGVPALTPADALRMLASAITYLQSAGLTVKAGNDARLGLVLAIEGAQMKQDALGVMTFEPREAASTAERTSTPADAIAASTPTVPAHG